MLPKSVYILCLLMYRMIYLQVFMVPVINLYVRWTRLLRFIYISHFHHYPFFVWFVFIVLSFQVSRRYSCSSSFCHSLPLSSRAAYYVRLVIAFSSCASCFLCFLLTYCNSCASMFPSPSLQCSSAGNYADEIITFLVVYFLFAFRRFKSIIFMNL